ncbi:MAG: hypothetical protein EBS86_12240 [Crocinitomicaceae bacterium]|nr:hypothetical protein [Crocinitomicaceae bacterium]
MFFLTQRQRQKNQFVFKAQDKGRKINLYLKRKTKAEKSIQVNNQEIIRVKLFSNISLLRKKVTKQKYFQTKNVGKKFNNKKLFSLIKKLIFRKNKFIYIGGFPL